MSDKPREMYGNFTGGTLDDGSCQIWEMHFSPYSEEDIKDGKGTEFEPVHWIEKSAFDQLCEELNLEKHYHKSYFEKGEKYLEELTKLRSLCDEMAKALELIGDKHLRCDCMDTAGIANEALAKYRELMGEK